jgi:sugar phosphate isomerase/epimerase
MTVNRRTFVHALGASIGATALSGPFSAIGSRTRLARVGLELYSVRDAMKRDPERTLAAVRKIGYTDVELLWSHGNFGRTTAQVRASLTAEGLRAPSAHIAPETLLTNWEQSLETAKVLGHEYLIVPSLPDETRRSLDAWRRWADHFNTAGGAARKAGIWLAFHNEPDHMPPIDGVVPYDLFMERTDPSLVRLQLDVGNMVVGGGDPMRYLAQHSARYTSFHLKDAAAGGKHDTELGAGTFDLRRFLAAVPDVNRKPCYVEQEEATDALASAAANFTFLRALEF